MGSSERLCGTQLWLIVFLAFSTLSDGFQHEVMSSPNLLQVGVAQNIFVEIQDCQRQDNVIVEVSVMSHPNKNILLASTFVTLSKANNFQGLGQITIPPDGFSKDPNLKQYVCLRAQFPRRLLEKDVLVSFRAGHIYIQTDKTIYTPGSRVYYRTFAVSPDMETEEWDDSVHIEILNPDGIVNEQSQIFMRSGMHSGGLHLSASAAPGLWKVEARFSSTPQISFTAEFEVKEYVLPRFEVKLTPLTPYFYPEDRELTINIRARYLSGVEVDGTAFVVFGVIRSHQKESFPNSFQRVPIMGGNGEVKLRREYITQSHQELLDLVGSSIYVSVNVLTESDGEMVDAELRNIRIVISPYTISFKKSPKYFKPGMPFDVVVEVLNPDDTPASGVTVSVEPGLVFGFTSDDGLAMFTINTPPGAETFRLIAQIRDPRIITWRQPRVAMEVHPYSSISNSWIHIGLVTGKVRLGTFVKFALYLYRRDYKEYDITYLILSRGQVVKYGRYKTQTYMVIFLEITKQMLPSFRFVAYYHKYNNEVVSDSLLVDVKDTCTDTLRLEQTMPFQSYMPRKIFGLKITGDPQATVGLVAVDKRAYELNKQHLLTQKKVWDAMKKYDTGCTPGSGSDAMSVFYDAGLLFKSTVSGTPTRTDLNCPVPSRRKRACDILDIMNRLPRDSEDEDSYFEIEEIVSRTKFPESWLWSEIKLPRCSFENPNCESTSIKKNVPLPDSVTEWQIIGISRSRTNGICVVDPLAITVRKLFFIDLKLPYSAVRGEQLEILAILHNNDQDPVTMLMTGRQRKEFCDSLTEILKTYDDLRQTEVRLDLMAEQHLCSVASAHGKYRQVVEVGPETSRSVPFVIIPMREGQYQVEVKAAVKDLFINDGVTRMLRVVPEGRLVKSRIVTSLNPAEKGVEGKQVEILHSHIPLKDVVPRSTSKTVTYLIGEKMVNIMENIISGESVESLMNQHEPSIFQLEEYVTAVMYLDKTNQWETVGFEKRATALQRIKTGFRSGVRDSYINARSPWSGTQSLTWRIAQRIKMFTMALNLVSLESRQNCDTITFLVNMAQLPDGQFRERNIDSDDSLTAFCLIAMQESRAPCAATVATSINKAVAYLERRLPHLTSPYAVAMISYALANENKLNREILYNFASLDLSHWPVPSGHLDTLIATAYALLALVKAKLLEEARPVVRWLRQQERVRGRFGSPEATMMVYQALAEYWTTAKEQEYNLNVDILLPGRSRPDRFFFNMDKDFTRRLSSVNTINNNIYVNATGNGKVKLIVESSYYTPATEEEGDCQSFDLSVQLLPVTMNGAEKIYELKIEVLYKGRARNSSVVVLDIGLLTGFTVNKNDLNLIRTRMHTNMQTHMVSGSMRPILRYEMNRVLSEKRSLIIYLDGVSRTRPEVITFRIHQKLRVGFSQPAHVSVYEYSEQEAQCVKFYHPTRAGGQLLKLCPNDECICAEENCSMQKKKKIAKDERISKICQLSPAQKDFMFKVGLENVTYGLSADVYTMRILKVIREGRYDVGTLGKLRHFFSFPRCREALDLKRDKTYLIVGSTKNIRTDKQDYLYLFGEETWIEYWPTDAECQTEEHRATCLGLEETIQLCLQLRC